MARTSAKAKKQKEVSKRKEEATEQEDAKQEDDQQENKPSTGNEDAYDSTDKENDDANNYEVEKIVHTRLYRGKRQYLVRWKGYKEDSDTWENESAIQSCTEALDAFKKEHPLSGSKDDSEADDEDSQDDVEEQEKKKSKKGSAKKTGKKEKAKSKKETTEKKDEVNGEAVSDNEKSAKKRKQEDNDTPAKKVKFDDDSDGSVTDGVNYEVEKILEVHTKKDGRREFLIRWKGYRPSEDTWEPEAHLNCKDMIAKFMERVDKAKSIPARELREVRTPPARFIPTVKAKNSKNLRNSGLRPCYQE